MKTMKELYQTVVKLPYSINAEQVVFQIEQEVKKYWNQGWIFVKAETDGLMESVCIYFEREVFVE